MMMTRACITIGHAGTGQQIGLSFRDMIIFGQLYNCENAIIQKLPFFRTNEYGQMYGSILLKRD